MATGVAHELNNPLNVIRIGADFILKNVRKGRTMSDEELTQIANEFVANVERAARIINHLRDFGRKPELKMFPIDVNVPIQGAFTLLGTQLKKSNIRVELELEENLPLIMGGKNRLEQVFLNLITNARDAMLDVDNKERQQGQTTDKILRVKSFRDGDRVVVTVSDTGPGIPRFLRSRIFEPFFTTKKRGEGTGLGLSISYGIIREHQGKIELDGLQERGTTFRLTFPAIDESSETKHGENTGY
jgi:histidine kinase